MAVSFHCSPETTAALLIGYTPIENKNLKSLPTNKSPGPDGFIGKLCKKF